MPTLLVHTNFGDGLQLKGSNSATTRPITTMKSAPLGLAKGREQSLGTSHHDFACFTWRKHFRPCLGLVYHRHVRRPAADRDLIGRYCTCTVTCTACRPTWNTSIQAYGRRSRLLHCTALHQNSAEGAGTIAIVLDGHLVMTGGHVACHNAWWPSSLYKDLSRTNLP